MSIAILQLRKEPFYRRNAFEVGLRKHGYAIDPLGQPRPKDKRDLLVLWNKKAGAEESQADAWERAGGTVIVVENGYLQKVDKTHYAISVHGHNGSGWFPNHGEDRFSKLGFEIKPYRAPVGGKVLVCGQRSIGSTLMSSPPQWAENTQRLLMGRVRHTVKVRPHPGNFAPKVPLIDDLKTARACVVWSSSAGVRAMVEGVVTFYCAPHWVCAGAALRGVTYGLIDVPPLGEFGRAAALNHMAHGQWHHEEIATGEPFARILAGLEHATWP